MLKLDPLTGEQTEIIKLIAQGYKDRQIAQIQYRNMRTLKNHIANIRARLGFTGAERNTRVLMARWVWENDPDFK